MSEYKIKTVNGIRTYPKHYFRWRSMKSRCQSKSSPEFIRYGARGIYVCEEWKIYKNFHDWCERTYEDGKSIDRINNDGPYSPKNCTWSTPAEQQLTARKTQAKRDAIKIAKKAYLEKVYAQYGDPLTRTEKKCYMCKQIKPLDAYNKNRTTNDGHQRSCRLCDVLRRKKL